MPWDSQAERESAELGNAAADTRTSLGARFGEVERELGFGTGAGNPYSQAALLKNRLETNRRGVMTTAGNQLYAGSTVNKQAAATRQYDIGRKRLEDDYASARAAYSRGKGRTQRDLELGKATIQEGALNRLAASDPGRAGPAGGGAARRRRRSGRRGRGRGGATRPGSFRATPQQARQLTRRLNRRY